MVAGPPVVRYPKPSAYRNPYVVRRPGLGPGAKLSGTAERVCKLAATGEYETMSALGAAVGVSRERVRQIIRQYDIPWQDAHVRLEWECPGCGAEITVHRSLWENNWTHMPAHCRSCSWQDKDKFCIRGHLRSEETGAGGECLACVRLKATCVIEVRICEICRQPLNISRGALKQETVGRAVGKYHRRCWIRKLGRGRRKTHCKRGHEFTEENTYRWRGTRQCRACNLLRYHLRASRDAMGVRGRPVPVSPPW